MIAANSDDYKPYPVKVALTAIFIYRTGYDSALYRDNCPLMLEKHIFYLTQEIEKANECEQKLARGNDHRYAAHLADEWENRKKEQSK